MLKKYILLLVVAALFVFPLLGQERVNNSVLTYKASSAILNSATGWYYDSSCEEWVEYENALVEKEYCSSYAPSWRVLSYAIQNFNNMCFRTIEYGGKRYYILRYEYTKGYYRYPNIQMDWTACQPTVLCLYSESEGFKDDITTVLIMIIKI